MFLEAQFGAENCVPIAVPKMHTNGETEAPASPSKLKEDADADGASDGHEDDDSELEALQRKEIERLHKIGVPVPGVEIKVDKMVAKVWLEDLEVECANRVFGERVRAVVERAVEVTAPLWG